MPQSYFVRLEDRGVLSIAGEDRVTFLQGLVSNDVRKVSPERAIYSALLTPQGKFLHDFFLAEHDGGFLLDCEAERRDDLRQRLGRYRLRSKVQIADVTEQFAAAALIGPEAAPAVGLAARERGKGVPVGEGIAFVDPRLSELGVRLILPRASGAATLAGLALPEGTAADYDRRRVSLGVPAGSRDMPVDKAFLLESGFDELDGVDWQKGCYVGQELTARTKYRGLVRKRLLPVRIEGPAPEPGTPVMLGEKHAGDMRSAHDGLGLALLRLETVTLVERGEGVLTAGAARLQPYRPDWMRLPEPGSGDPG